MLSLSHSTNLITEGANVAFVALYEQKAREAIGQF